LTKGLQNLLTALLSLGIQRFSRTIYWRSQLAGDHVSHSRPFASKLAPTDPVFVSGLDAVFSAARVGGQRFSARQHRGHLAQFRSTLGRAVNDRRTFLEVVHPERRGEARSAGGRQHMVRPGAVVAQRLGSVAAHENRTGMADLIQILL